jgi:hypothetical protein
MRHEYYKLAAPSLKIHSPYNHFKPAISKSGYDANYRRITGMSYVQEMLSCRIEESGLLEYELRKASRNDHGSRFIKITKEMCGQ